MTLSLTCNAISSLPIELEGFTPDWARDTSLREIEQFQVLCGNRKLPLGELFQVKGKPVDGAWEVDGDLSAVHGIGAGMCSGTVRIRGPVGRHVGRGMQGGEIHVDGDAGDFLGAEMRGGFIHVHGNAGNLVGAACRGASRGMTGGMILVDGNAGNEVGAAMRRGLIAVGGTAGELVGHNMLAGTIVICGLCGAHPGIGVRRGTLVIAGANRATLPRGYQFACVSHPPVLPLLFHELKRHGFNSDTSLECETYNGHMLTGGRGEILLCNTA